MTLFGVDVSKYQGTNAVDGFDFAILNVEDPSYANKARHCADTGITWDIYKWCHPGVSGAAEFQRAKYLVDANYPGGRYPGFWLDYEESGVTGNQVGEWFTAADAAGVQSGWYVYLYLINAQGNHAPGRPLWLAYYPSSSPEWHSSYSDTARAKGAQIHQYTSTGGTLDRNVIIDEAWWAEWSGGDDLNEQQTRELIDKVLFDPADTGFGISRVDAAIQKYVFEKTDALPDRDYLHFLKAVEGSKDYIKKTLGL